jgi:hypothetical protein
MMSSLTSFIVQTIEKELSSLLVPAIEKELKKLTLPIIEEEINKLIVPIIERELSNFDQKMISFFVGQVKKVCDELMVYLEAKSISDLNRGGHYE